MKYSLLEQNNLAVVGGQLKRAEKVISQIITGSAKLRKTERFGYWTIALGHCERGVIVEDIMYVFNKHKDYESFINSKR